MIHNMFHLSSAPRVSPRLLCTAAQQKNGHSPEDESEKTEQSAADKVLTEKTQLEEQLKDMTVSWRWVLQVQAKDSRLN